MKNTRRRTRQFHGQRKMTRNAETPVSLGLSWPANILKSRRKDIFAWKTISASILLTWSFSNNTFFQPWISKGKSSSRKSTNWPRLPMAMEVSTEHWKVVECLLKWINVRLSTFMCTAWTISSFAWPIRSSSVSAKRRTPIVLPK